MREVLLHLHRWFGLSAAGFLVVAGLTGAVISWDHELDEVLNSHLLDASASGPMRSPLEMALELEERYPQAEVTYLPLDREPGHSLAFGVDPRVNPETGELFDLGFNQVFVDPVSGEELGRRDWGAVWPLSRENAVSFLYVLHYSLHLPGVYGVVFMGGLALLWTLDCFAGLYLTLPRWGGKAGLVAWLRRWGPAWRIKVSGSAYRLNMDIHRAAGLWTFALLFVLAFSAFSLNLYREVFLPILSSVSEVTPTPFDLRDPRDKNDPLEAAVDFETIVETARRYATDRGLEAPVGSIYYARSYGVYVVSFFAPGDDLGVAGVGPPILYLDGADARYLGDFTPWEGTAADIFNQAQFPVHSGRILGLPGRILMSLMGIVVAGLSVTGVVIWWKKHRARAHSRQRSV